MRVWLIYEDGRIVKWERYWGDEDFRWEDVLEWIPEGEDDPIGILILPNERAFTLDISQ